MRPFFRRVVPRNDSDFAMAVATRAVGLDIRTKTYMRKNPALGLVTRYTASALDLRLINRWAIIARLFNHLGVLSDIHKPSRYQWAKSRICREYLEYKSKKAFLTFNAILFCN